MAILPILEVPDPRLRRISEPVVEITEDIRALIVDMFETMYDAPGIGLAAAQVDVPIRLLVMDLGDGPEDEEGKGTPNPRVFINPELFDPSEDYSVYNEGCLSVPGQYADVERPATIRATWLDETGAAHDEVLDELTATCLQHEMDHLEGILFIDHLSRLKRDMVLKKLDKARKEKPAKKAAA
ncbi:peptide deformylase [Sandaracinobacter neustonicus]|uniref:Peptide deformylase n=1 Tax=Sandaracinobacter neustonicus TaxID=1715348 RepID=A0A501XP32_9SPHN|nr:peptide deformylase [Sandaracinobacter neustonicus]TPE62229.1 peptide deformylase [Sandaracinobacter neustonicus]